MVALVLEKHLESGKMFVKSWYFIRKDSIESHKAHAPDVVVVDQELVPKKFYEDPTIFFYENNQLVNSRGIYKDTQTLQIERWHDRICLTREKESFDSFSLVFR